MDELQFLNIEYPESKNRIDDKSKLTWNNIASLMERYEKYLQMKNNVTKSNVTEMYNAKEILIMKQEIVNFEIAKILKEKGFNERTTFFYKDEVVKYSRDFKNDKLEKPFESLIGGVFNNYNDRWAAPTYHQVIDWIFEERNWFEIKEYRNNFTEDYKYHWLEFWYEQLKDCPLKYEFKGRLLEWFRDNNSHSYIKFWQDSYKAQIRGIDADDPTLIYWKTHEDAEHQAILEIFKLLKN